MPPKSLHKVHKHLVKKKGSRAPALHENSRDSQRLRRATARHDKLALAAATRQKQTQPFLERVLFFQSKAAAFADRNPPIDKNRTAAISLAALQELIQEYITRHDPELQTLRQSRRPSRPAHPRQTALEALHARDAAEYASGFWVPDLEDSGGVAALLRWDGMDWQALNAVPFCRVARDGGKRSAWFPPSRES